MGILEELNPLSMIPKLQDINPLLQSNFVALEYCNTKRFGASCLNGHALEVVIFFILVDLPSNERELSCKVLVQ